MKKAILYTLIATFAISALFGIIIIVLGLWNDLTAKVLLTTVTIFGYSIPSLCCAAAYEKTKDKWFPTTGLVVGILSGIYVLLLIWEIIDFDLFGKDSEAAIKLLFSAIVLPLSLGHINLLCIINSEDSNVKIVRNATIVFSIVLDILLLSLIWIDDFDEVIAWEIYAIVAILIVLGTIVSPILAKARKIGTNVTVNNVPNNKEIAKSKLNDLLNDKYVTQEEYQVILERIEKKE